MFGWIFGQYFGDGESRIKSKKEETDTTDENDVNQ